MNAVNQWVQLTNDCQLLAGNQPVTFHSQVCGSTFQCTWFQSVANAVSSTILLWNGRLDSLLSRAFSKVQCYRVGQHRATWSFPRGMRTCKECRNTFQILLLYSALLGKLLWLFTAHIQRIQKVLCSPWSATDVPLASETGTRSSCSWSCVPGC